MEKKKIVDLTKVVMLIHILAWPTFTYSQNLVLNNDFEELVMDIGTHTTNGVVIDGEPDTTKVWGLRPKDHTYVKAKYYQPVRGNEQSGCYSNIGYARSGRIYGLIEYYSFLGTSNEAYHIANTEGRFCKPLLKGKNYTFCFWIKPFVGNITADSVQVDFHGLGDYERNEHREVVPYKKPKRFVKKHNQGAQKRKFISMALPNDKEKYSQICVEYTAKGGELGFKVGNLDMHLPYFRKFEDLEHFGHDYERIKSYKYPFISYIIDDISMVSNTDNADFCLTPMPNTYRYSNDIRLRSAVRSESKKITVNSDFLFEPNSSRVNTASDGFKNVVKELNAFNADKIVIVGHTDNRGADAYNLQLSIERGENMQKALLSSLIKAPQFSVIGMGESQPITTNETAEGRQKNRRVEIEVFRYD